MASALGSSTFVAAICSSSGRYGTRPMIRAKSVWTLRVSASTSRDSTRLVRHVGEGADEVRVLARALGRGARGAAPGRARAASRRGRGSSCGRSPPSRPRRGRRSRAPRPSSFRTVTSASIRSPETTSSISLIERSCPIASGVIESGKTTVSLSGSSGSSAGTSMSSLDDGLDLDVGHAQPHLDRRRAPAAARAGASGQLDRQQAALVAGARRVDVDRLGQLDPALERPVVDLHLLVLAPRVAVAGRGRSPATSEQCARRRRARSSPGRPRAARRRRSAARGRRCGTSRRAAGSRAGAR